MSHFSNFDVPRNHLEMELKFRFQFSRLGYLICGAQCKITM